MVLSVSGSNDHEQEEDDNCDEIEVEEEQKEYEWKDYSAKGLQTLLSQQPDFANEKCMLEEELEAKGDLCIFLPKFHCELNMIEVIWDVVNTTSAAHSIKTKELCVRLLVAKVVIHLV